MNKPIYIYVAGRGFVMNFEKSGSGLKFAQYIAFAQEFDTVQQANNIIRVNALDPVGCVLLQQV